MPDVPPNRSRKESPRDAADERALRLHAFYRGKTQLALKCPVRGLEDLAVWYTPGVAAPCRIIARDPERAFEYTNRGNTIAVVSDGTRVLGLGDIGPEAGLPVMEGKALLFKYLGGVDAVPLCLRAKDPAALADVVAALEPSFGGINLEDIAQPKCFRLLDALRSRMAIPVWHDDQQGTAVVTLAAVLNALEIVGKRLDRARIALVGAGAANTATYRLLKRAGANPANFIVCDSTGILDRARTELADPGTAFLEKREMCSETNAEGISGGIAEALRGADVCLAFSTPRPGTIRPDWVRAMARDAVVFACANPAPEIWPEEAFAAGARIVATGRCDLPNQVNNALCFPAIFRGVLDVQARTISDGMAIAAARELAACAHDRGLREDHIVPRIDEWDLYPRVAAATALAAQREGVAHTAFQRVTLLRMAQARITAARAATDALMTGGLIAERPAV